MQPNETYIYWEKQGAGRLCGVHCINSLLQGPFYTPEALASIALDLDMKESHLLEGLTGPSNNVDDDGNYSVQVLIEALNRVGQGLKIEPISTLNSDFSKIQGFLCHSDAHWFGLRNVQGTWYNLNSTLSKMPQLVTHSQLQTFLQKNSQSTTSCKVFALIGSSLPTPKQTDFDHYEPFQRWVKESDIRKHYEETIAGDGIHGLYMYGLGEEEMMAMIQMALKEEQWAAGDVNGKVYSEDQLIAIALQYQKEHHKDGAAGVAGADGAAPVICEKPSAVAAAAAVPVHYGNFDILFNSQDPDFFLVTRQSLQCAFSHQPPTGQPITFKFPNKPSMQRLFNTKDKVQTLYDYAFLKMTDNYPQHLYRFFLSSNGEPLSKLSQPIQGISIVLVEKL